MSPSVMRLHASIQYYEALGAWGMAQELRKILVGIMRGVS